MRSIFIDDNNIEELEKPLKIIEKEFKSLMILSCDGNNYNIEQVDNILKKVTIPIFGGIFPAIIFGDKKYDIGTIIVGLNDDVDISIIENMSIKEDFDDEIEDKIPQLDSNIKTMFVYVDGLGKNINQIIDGLFNNFGLNINYLGGGAGSLDFVQKPCIFTNEGLKKDCVQLIVSKMSSNIGVKHGWEIISEQLNITKSNGNIIEEIDYENVFEVYKSIVEEKSGEKFNDDNFFDIAKGYPFGINKLDAEMVVRDPIIENHGSLVCVGDVPRNSIVNILQGIDKNLINAANEAAAIAIEDNNENSFTIFIDCISRVLFLEDKFSNEIAEVYKVNSKLVGALTLGEIANNKDHYLEFYNKTAVVGSING
jgi:hypothetical protein